MIMSSSGKIMSSSGKIRVPAEEYVIYFPPTDQSDSRITLNCSIRVRDSYWRARTLANSGFRGLMRDSFFLIDFGLVVTIYQTSKSHRTRYTYKL